MEVIPADNKDYATREYWEKRYNKDATPFDWFKGYTDLKAILSETIKKSDKILNIGCGNSKLSEEMYADGYHQIINCDFSETVIQQMSEKCKAMSEMKWVVCDVREMNCFANGTFDVVIDKGTMDAVMCEQGDVWELDEKIAAEVGRMISEVSRVLSANGTFIYVTFGQPHFRKPVLTKPQYGWELEVKTIGEFFHYFVYIMRKKPTKTAS